MFRFKNETYSLGRVHVLCHLAIDDDVAMNHHSMCDACSYMTF